MDIRNTNFKLEHFQKANIDSVVDNIDSHLRRTKYRSAFQEAAEAIKDSNADYYNVYCLMSAIMSMHFKPSDVKEPFGPMFVLDDCRSFIPSDLPSETLDVLSGFYDEIKDPELRARITDLVWLSLRKPEHAKNAIQSYVKAAEKTEDPEHWTTCAEYLERALRLSAMFRQKDPTPFVAVTEAIKEVIDRYDGADPKYLSLRLIKRLVEFSDDYLDGFYALSVKIAKQAVSVGDWSKAENAWEVAQDCATALGDQSKRDEALKEQADTYVLQAEDGSSGMNSSHWMQKAIEVNRRLPDSNSRNKELYSKLREYQLSINDEMSSFESDPIDISQYVKQARNTVSGHSFQDALFSLAFKVCTPLDYEKLRKDAEEDSENFVFQRIVGTVQYDRDGLIVAEVPPMSGQGDDNDEKALWSSMLRSAQFIHDLSVKSGINPARREILLEHNVAEEDFFCYIKNNPFIESGHEHIFAKGLNFGLHGDFISAIHILIPQLESSFRHVLAQKGVEPTTLNTKGIQEHIRISTILDHEKFAETFGKDITLELKGLLVDRKYANYRNEVSHGLMHSTQFYSTPAIYLWWLTLRLCLMPFFSNWNTGDEQKNDSKGRSG